MINRLLKSIVFMLLWVQVTVVTQASDLARDWFLVFNDPDLMTQLDYTQANNPAYRVSIAQYDVAKQGKLVAQASRLPQITALASSDHQALSKRGANGTAEFFELGLANRNQDVYRAGIQGNWVLDSNGNQRATIAAAGATADAAYHTQYTQLITALSATAHHYVSLKRDLYRRDLIQAMIQLRQDLVDYRLATVRSGLVPQSVLNQDKTQLANTLAQLPAIASAIQSSRGALQVLTGKQPILLSEALQPIDIIVPDITPDDSQQLARNRPDIRAMQATVDAAKYTAKATQSNHYPQIGLTGYRGYESITSDDLISDKASMWSIGTYLNWSLSPVTRAQSNLADSQVAEHQATYTARLSEATESIVTTRQAFTYERQRYTAYESALATATQQRNHAIALYDAGLAGKDSVILATLNQLALDDALIQSRASLWHTAIALYQATAGTITVNTKATSLE